MSEAERYFVWENNTSKEIHISPMSEMKLYVEAGKEADCASRDIIETELTMDAAIILAFDESKNSGYFFNPPTDKEYK